MEDTFVSEQENIVGGCLCGDIRYEIAAPPKLTEYCHCSMCRKATGAAVMSWAGVARESFRFLHGKHSAYPSSPGVERSFCGRCGTSLTHYSKQFPEEIYVSIATFDDAQALAPEIHIWREDRLAWFETTDDLPRYTRFKSDGIMEETGEDVGLD